MNRAEMDLIAYETTGVALAAADLLGAGKTITPVDPLAALLIKQADRYRKADREIREEEV